MAEGKGGSTSHRRFQREPLFRGNDELFAYVCVHVSLCGILLADHDMSAFCAVCYISAAGLGWDSIAQTINMGMLPFWHWECGVGEGNTALAMWIGQVIAQLALLGLCRTFPPSQNPPGQIKLRNFIVNPSYYERGRYSLKYLLICIKQLAIFSLSGARCMSGTTPSPSPFCTLSSRASSHKLVQPPGNGDLSLTRDTTVQMKSQVCRNASHHRPQSAHEMVDALTLIRDPCLHPPLQVGNSRGGNTA